MANVKLSDMTPGAALTGAELVEMTQSATTYSTTASAMKTFVLGSGTQTVTVRVVTAAGTITITSADHVVAVNKTTGAATAVTLPAGVTGQTYVIKDMKGDAVTNNITITPAAGTIDGAGTLVISANYGSKTLVYNGASWSVV